MEFIKFSGRGGLFTRCIGGLISLLMITGMSHAATITVDSSADLALPSNDGDCTLREALIAAKNNIAVDGCSAGNGADTIQFAGGINSITITAGDLTSAANSIRESLNIEGPGIDSLEISGNDLYQLFYINSLDASQSFSFSGLSLLNGFANLALSGGAIYKRGAGTLDLSDMVFESNTSPSGGGAVFIAALTSAEISSLNVLRCTFSNNTSSQNGGGAIRAARNSVVNIKDSTFSNNVSMGSSSDGGAIYVLSSFGGISGSAQIDILRSTFQGNQSDQNGGAIYLSGSSPSPVTASIRHSTILSNRADLDQADASNGSGGGIATRSYTDLTLANNIIAKNLDTVSGGATPYDDISLGLGVTSSSSIVSEGFNFIGATNSTSLAEFPEGNPNANSDYVGTPGSKLVPNIQPQSDNGGTTETFQPTIGGNLVDKGSCGSEPYDQRGYGNTGSNSRLVDIPGISNGSGSDGCDIGAVELSAELLTSTEESTCFPVTTASGNAAIICL